MRKVRFATRRRRVALPWPSPRSRQPADASEKIEEQAAPARHAQRRLHPRLGRDRRGGAQGNRPEERVRRDLLAVHRGSGQEGEGQGWKGAVRVGSLLRAVPRATKLPVEKENCGRINKETLKNFDVVLFFTTGNPVNKEELADLREWVKAGGALAGTHCATDTLYGESVYGDLIGAYFKGHPPGLQKIKVKIEDAEAPGRGRLHRRHGLPGRNVRVPRCALQPREVAHHPQHRPGFLRPEEPGPQGQGLRDLLVPRRRARERCSTPRSATTRRSGRTRSSRSTSSGV